MLSLNYFRKNKVQTFTTVFSMALASVLLFTISILFSSFREYLILNSLKSNDYHVKITGYLKNEGYNYISSLKLVNDEYLIKFKDIHKTYENTDKICAENECIKKVYNNTLLSLYGIGDNNYLSLFKTLILMIGSILAISVFFIIFNSFQIGINKRRKDIALLKAVGLTNIQLYKVFLFEGVLCAILGAIFGFLISVLVNLGIINLINYLFKEVLSFPMQISFYMPFIFISLCLMILVALCAIALPLVQIRKYKVMEVFRENNKVEQRFYHFKNFTLNYAYTNYKRSQKKYRVLIICVFVFVILFNSFFKITDYTLTIIKEYVRLPKYDLKVVMTDYDSLEALVKKFSYTKKVMYKSCFREVTDIKGEYKNKVNIQNALVTNLGGNKVVNLIDEVLILNDRGVINNYPIFNSLEYIDFDGVRLDGLDLSSSALFGFENELLSGQVLLSLDEYNFNKVCPAFVANVLLKTGDSNLDDKLSKYALDRGLDISYVNVKKAYVLINNITLLFKIFSILCIILVGLIAIFTVFNVIYGNINLRRSEFASLKSLGFSRHKINLCLALESLIVSGKGIIYSLPFVLLISNNLYRNLGGYFALNTNIFDYKMFLFSGSIVFVLVLLCTIICHMRIYKCSLISNIKGFNG